MIKLRFDGQEILVKMDNSTSAKSFLALLPLKVKAEDYAGKEKIFSIPRRLETGAGDGANYNPQIGDLFYFSPWGNIGIFYDKQPPYNGLIRLGILQGADSVSKLKAQKSDFELEILRAE
ncbi:MULTISPECIES: cyclophilin-like fold protein [unclassified Helicobacter]|uniref:cyclophilin-like fold protein n=1 Tax=unclassified Helicobacter TaxID=2593540 RepID=UPI0015F16158|nr:MULTISPECIES: cyclophilin-like fold protein [unclassified Helicobacter]